MGRIPDNRGRKPKNANRKWPAVVVSHQDVLDLLACWSLTAPAHVRNRAMVWLIYRYDLKGNEVTNLATWHYERGGDVLTVPATTANRPERDISIDPVTRDLLDAWLDHRERVGIGPNPPLFCTVENSKGAKLTTNKLNNDIRRVLQSRGRHKKRITTEGLRKSGRQHEVAGAAVRGLPQAAARAQRHLQTAFDCLGPSRVDASTAYKEAARAVEAAAKPILTPKDRLATLGKMITAVRDAPQKWTTTVGDISDVQRMMELLWTSQLDRHGTDDDDTPMHVSPEQADVALHLALVLTRLFAAGHVRPAAQVPR